MKTPEHIVKDQPFKTTVITKCDELADCLKLMKPVAGNGISLNETAAGTVFAVLPGTVSSAKSGGASAYSGFFKVVIDGSDPDAAKVKVVDGADQTGAVCGYYEHGIIRKSVATPAAIAVTASGVVYVKITYDTDYVFEFLFAAELPASENGSIIRKIASVVVTDGKITNVIQAQNGVLITPGVL